MSYYGGGMGMQGGGKQQMLSVCSSILLLCAVAGGAYMMMNKTATKTFAVNTNTNTNNTNSPVLTSSNQMSSSGSVGRGLDGQYNITYGNMSLSVNPKDCATNNVWFANTMESSPFEWNLRTVPGTEDVYTIRSEDRAFDKGCDAAYLEAPASCTGPMVLARPTGNSDNQFWKVIPSTTAGGNTTYELMSVSCSNKRWPSYMISSGTLSGVTNSAKLAARDGSSYTLRKTGLVS